LSKKRSFVLYIVIAILLWVLDRFSKIYVSTHFGIGDVLPLGNGFVSIRLTFNTGVSFSLFAEHTMLLTIAQGVLSIIVLVAFIALCRRGGNRVFLLGLSWILAGGLGNFYDRVQFGYVVDFISVGSFPVWNFADMCIVGGCILIGIYALFGNAKASK